MKLYYVADFRPEWKGRPCVTFWRPKSAGYAYPLPWSGQYEFEELKAGYHEKQDGRKLLRFPVPCDIVDSLGTLPPTGLIDGDAGPVVLNTAQNRRALRKARLGLSTLESRRAK